MLVRHPCRRFALTVWLVLLGIVPSSSRIAAQEGTDVVRGRVIGPGKEPIAHALVTVTGTQTQATRDTRTNATGLFTVLFASGEGEYIVEVRALGFAPAISRVAREGDESIIIADVGLTRVAVQLETVTSIAARPRPPRSSTDGRSVGGLDQDMMRGALFSLDPGDLVALATQVPGVLAIPGANGDSSAFSVLGASPDQNNIVVDGSAFEGGALPPDALAGARMITTTFDPGRGQFSGGQLSAQTRGGTDIFRGTMRANFAHPQLSWADRASPRPVPRMQAASGSIGGPIRRRKAHYFAAFDLRASLTDARSLLDPHEATLTQSGLSRDSIGAFIDAVDALGAPLTRGDIPEGSSDDRQSGFVKMDFTPTATTSLVLRADGAWSQRGGSGISALALPTLASESKSSQFGLQLSGSAYLGGFLDEFRSYLQRSASSTAPYISLPSATVRVGVEREDGAAGLTSLRFGGGSRGGNERESTKWETTNELSWIAGDSRHRVKLGQSIAIERTSTSQAADQFGTYSYESIGALAANQPSSYTRTIAASGRNTNALSGALWIGDEWRAASNLRFQYGARVDLSRPTTTPALNPEVEELFGLRTDRVPEDVGYSPRFGFSWSPWAPPPAGMRPGMARPPVRAMSSWRSISFSGGVGAFRGVIPPGRIASLVDATGLPSTTRRLTCVGDATPIPDWDLGRGAAADVCLDGTAPTEFSSNQPTVQVFSPGYEAPVSWRGNLSVNGLALRGWRLGLNGTYSLGMNGESSIDLNLRRTAAFTLPDEASRPVFASETSIVPATGAVAPGASRITDRYGRVSSIVSDLRSAATQLQLSLAPPRPLFGKIPLNASYTYSRQRAQERGFSGSTAGDPFSREWADGRQPVHQVQLMTSARLWRFSLGVRLNVQSGTPYTPQVAGDVNGDGSSNDRAFIPDPATTADPALAQEFAALLESAPARARACLRAQLGEIAGRNSCRTGWQVRPDLSLNFNPPDNFGVGDRLRFSVRMLNASGALFRLLGLADSPLGRAAAPGAPNPTLLYVTGFDPAARRFQYRVNQQFGDAARVGRRSGRYSSPFQVQLGVEYGFGGPPRDRMARSLGLVPDKGDPPLSPDQIRARLRTLNSNPLDLLLAMRDTLQLTSEQTASIEAISSRFTARADSAVAPLVEYLVERKGRVNDADVMMRLARVAPAMRGLMLEATGQVEVILTAEQREQLPPWFFSRTGGPRRMPAPGARR